MLTWVVGSLVANWQLSYFVWDILHFPGNKQAFCASVGARRFTAFFFVFLWWKNKTI